jgi:hypothetical protein
MPSFTLKVYNICDIICFKNKDKRKLKLKSPKPLRSKDFGDFSGE